WPSRDAVARPPWWHGASSLPPTDGGDAQRETSRCGAAPRARRPCEVTPRARRPRSTSNGTRPRRRARPRSAAASRDTPATGGRLLNALVSCHGAESSSDRSGCLLGREHKTWADQGQALLT